MTAKLSVTAGPTEPPVLEQTIGGLLKEAAREVPDRTAIIFGHADPALRREWTYQEMYNDAQRIALALATRFQPGERVAIWSQNVELHRILSQLSLIFAYWSDPSPR